MTPPIDTDPVVVSTGVKRTSAAHLVVDDEPITVIWSTIPMPCVDWLLGDENSQGPVRQGPGEVPTVRYTLVDDVRIWYADVEVRCEVCGLTVGPWALVRDGHLTGDELTDVAREVAELTDEERESQRGALVASLTVDAEDVAARLADGTLERDELPDLADMAEPGVGLHGDEVVAWATMPHPDGPSAYGPTDPEIVEVRRPIPTGDSVS